jgi:hypothetical protein
MSNARLYSTPPGSEPVTELSPLGRAARLLEDAQRSLLRAGDEADKRNRELLQRIQDLETSLGEMEQLLVRTERQASQLTNLYVATYQLHASLETSDVRAAIADIAVNLLGAERFTIWLKDEAGQLREDTQCYAGGDSLMDACLSNACPQFGPSEGSDAVAAVPFTRAGEVVGVLLIRAIFRHKPGLDAEDHELLDLMAAHAASALLAAQAFHVSKRKLNAYEGLLGFLRGGGS